MERRRCWSAEVAEFETRSRVSQTSHASHIQVVCECVSSRSTGLAHSRRPHTQPKTTMIIYRDLTCRGVGGRAFGDTFSINAKPKAKAAKTPPRETEAPFHFKQYNRVQSPLRLAFPSIAGARRAPRNSRSQHRARRWYTEAFPAAFTPPWRRGLPPSASATD